MNETICIIGGALAGGTACLTLRQLGYDGELILVSDEADAGYDRPSLSKAVLYSEHEYPPPLFEAGWIENNRIEYLSAERVTRVDIRSGVLDLLGGSELKASKVLLCTGSRARKPAISGTDFPGVYTLRTDRDSHAIRSSVARGSEVAIMGGGLIGCEVASSLAKMGCRVTIIEAASALLVRVLGDLGHYMQSQLAALGVTVLLDTQITAIEGNSHVSGIRLASGKLLPADMVLVAIGAEPNIELAEMAGLECSGGIVVDACGATNSEAIFAAGDAASWPIRGGGRRSLETYLNSQSQAQIAAAAMLGQAVPTTQILNSWTEIAGHRLQMAGDIVGPGKIVHRGVLGAGPSLAFRIQNGRTEAVIAIDSPAEFGVAKRMIDDRSVVLADELLDPTIRLRDIYKNKREVFQ